LHRARAALGKKLDRAGLNPAKNGGML
jgi:hypothetical protein